MANPDKKRVTKILTVSGISLLALLAVYWWSVTFELVEVKRRVNISEELHRNPYLFASQYLESFGKKVSTFRSIMKINELTTDVGTLVLLDLNSDLPATQYDILLHWISAGGHLILEAEYPLNDFDEEKKNVRLLQEFNLELVSLSDLNDEYEDEDVYDDEYENSDEEIGPDANDDSPPSECSAPDSSWNVWGTWNLVQVKMGEEQMADVVFSANSVLIPEGEEQNREPSFYIGKESYHMVQKEMGAGLISIVSNADFLSNPYISPVVGEEEPLEESTAISRSWKPSIDKFDHAYFLWLLVGDSSTVWVLYDMNYPTLLSILWNYFPHAIISFLALMLSWLWWMNNSFGPLHWELAGSRRSQLEHLHMSARFEWNADKAEARVKSARHFLSREFKHKHPRLARLGEPEASIALAEIVGLKVQQVDAALHGDWEKETRFIEITSLIQQIRRKL